MHAKRAFGWSLRTTAALTLIFTVTGFGQAISRGSSATRAADTPPVTAKDVAKDAVKPDTKPDTKVDNTELLRIVTALEDRVKELETRLAAAEAAKSQAPTGVAAVARTSSPNALIAGTAPAATSTGGNAVTPQVDIAELRKELDTLKEEQKKNSGFLGFFRDVEVSGLVDGYYSYNFNRPDGKANTGRAFDAYDNSFSLNLAKLTLEKKNDLANPLGFKLDLGYGPTVDIVNGPGPFGGQQVKNVLQAYLSYVVPVGNGLTVDFGKFVTPVGAEVIETKDNYNYTRSFMFAYGPYYHTGFRGKYTVNSKVSFTGFLLNGWDTALDNNNGKTYGMSVSLTPTSKFAITETYLGGPEQTGDSRPWRNFSDTVISYVATDKLTFLANIDYGTDKFVTGQKGHWFASAFYFKYAFNNRFAFSPRYEVFDDHDGFRTGLRQTLQEFTLTQEVKLVNNFITRFEFRRDWSNQDFFNKSVGNLVRSQNTLLIGLMYSWSSRGQ